MHDRGGSTPDAKKSPWVAVRRGREVGGGGISSAQKHSPHKTPEEQNHQEGKGVRRRV